VLTRTNSQLNAIDDALHDAGIPTRRRTGRTLFDNPAVRRQMSDDNESLRDWLAELQTTLAEGDHGVGVASDPATVEALRALVARGYEHLDAQPGATVGTFRIAMMSPDEFGFDGVDLLSFHAAKGLEWDTVVIAGAEKGLIPHASAVGTAGAAEERRLFYVAVTRATRQVIATWAQRRGTQTRDASKLLDALTRPFDDATDNDAPVPRPVRVRPPSDPRHDALLAWRDATARAANVESSFVLADRTLDAIILAAPRDESELAAVSGVGPLLAARFGEAILHTLHR
jgi:DNA helicase-2/ATP-dependent DNA helicase PcrA